MLELLQSRKRALRPTTTVVTRPDGRKFALNSKGESEELSRAPQGFVVDTKPDNVPALIVPHLYLGSQDCCDFLRDYDITHVLSLGIAPCTKYVDVCYEFVECLDLPETDLLEVLGTCVKFISDAVVEGCNVLVHCNAGVSRSASIVIGYLILNDGFDYDDAFNLVKKARECIRPNDGFVKQLKGLKQ